MRPLLAIFQQITDAGFVALAGFAIVVWWRDRMPASAALAAALTLMALVAALSSLRMVTGDPSHVIVDLSVVGFVGCGYALVLYRHALVPLRDSTLRLLTAVIVALGTLGFAFTPPGGPALGSRALTGAALAVLLIVWVACVLEPAVRLWLVARGLPPVQRSRLRTLSVALLGVVGVIALTAVQGVLGNGGAANPLRLLIQGFLIAILVLFALSLAPPAWLRRTWRAREERSYYEAVDELLHTSRDRLQVIGSALGWAVRLFGAASAVVVAPDCVHVAGAELAEVDLRRLARLTPSNGPRIERFGESGAHRVLAIPLRVEPNPMLLTIVAGRFTPPFGSDEVGRAAEFGASVTTALEMARTLEELARANERNDRLLGAISATGEGLVITESDRVVHANPAFCDLVGYDLAELRGLASLFELVPAEERPVLRGRMLAREGSQGGPAHYTSQLLSRDGQVIDVETVVQVLPGHGGKEVVTIVRDVTRRRRADLLRSVQFGVTSVLNVSPSLADAAPRVLEMIGEALGCRAVTLWLPGDSGEDFRAAFHWQPWTEALVRAVHGGEAPAEDHELVERVVRENACAMVGDDDELRALGFPVHADGGVNGVAVLSVPRSRLADSEIFDVLVDIGGRIGQHIVRRRAEAQLRDSVTKLAQMASTDPLTGLSNRRAFDHRLAEAGADRYAVLAIDVDNLKEINTAYTQEGGDLVLRAVAVTLSSLLRPGDLLARVGGDEFAAILPAVGAAEAAAVAERMRMAISAASMPVGRASISVGFVAAPPGADPEAVRAAAAEVLLQAKSRGKDRVEGGEPGAPLVRAAMDRDAELVGRIFEAGVMGVVYQPVVQLSDRVTMGFEALARPHGFPPLSSVEGLFSAAKRLGRLKEVDWLCRRVAIAQAPRMTGGHALFINVNAATVLHPLHPVDQTLLVLRSAGISARRVVFELSVREDVRDLERLRSVLADYRASHIRVAIDDVGARPSMGLVTAVRPDFIKVSSSLLTGRLSAGRRSALNTVIDTARCAGATLIAKGVETPQAADRAAELGFAWGQGFWLGPPASRQPARSRMRRGPLQQELPLPVHVTGHRVDRDRR